MQKLKLKQINLNIIKNFVFFISCLPPLPFPLLKGLRVEQPSVVNPF